MEERQSLNTNKKIRDIWKGRVFIIADMASNHNQDINTAKLLIDAAADAEVDAIKFQSFKIEEYYDFPPVNSKIAIERRNAEKRAELDESWWGELFDYSKSLKLIPFLTPTYPRAVDILTSIGVELFKIASDLTYGYPQLIDKIAKTGKPTIMSTGTCSFSEIDRAVNLFLKSNLNLILLHCVSEYPMEMKHANLRYIKNLKDRYKPIPVGFSDHSLGDECSIASVSLGAVVIEKHITLNRNQLGPDHPFSMEPLEFKSLVSKIRNVETALGYDYKLLCPSEIERKKIMMMKSIDGIRFRRDIDGVEAWRGLL